MCIRDSYGCAGRLRNALQMFPHGFPPTAPRRDDTRAKAYPHPPAVVMPPLCRPVLSHTQRRCPSSSAYVGRSCRIGRRRADGPEEEDAVVRGTLAPPAGIEPATPGFGKHAEGVTGVRARCAHLLHIPIFCKTTVLGRARAYSRAKRRLVGNLSAARTAEGCCRRRSSPVFSALRRPLLHFERQPLRRGPRVRRGRGQRALPPVC